MKSKILKSLIGFLLIVAVIIGNFVFIPPAKASNTWDQITFDQYFDLVIQTFFTGMYNDGDSFDSQKFIIIPPTVVMYMINQSPGRLKNNKKEMNFLDSGYDKWTIYSVSSWFITTAAGFSSLLDSIMGGKLPSTKVPQKVADRYFPYKHNAGEYDSLIKKLSKNYPSNGVTDNVPEEWYEWYKQGWDITYDKVKPKFKVENKDEKEKEKTYGLNFDMLQKAYAPEKVKDENGNEKENEVWASLRFHPVFRVLYQFTSGRLVLFFFFFVFFILLAIVMFRELKTRSFFASLWSALITIGWDFFEVIFLAGFIYLMLNPNNTAISFLIYLYAQVSLLLAFLVGSAFNGVYIIGVLGNLVFWALGVWMLFKYIKTLVHLLMAGIALNIRLMIVAILYPFVIFKKEAQYTPLWLMKLTSWVDGMVNSILSTELSLGMLSVILVVIAQILNFTLDVLGGLLFAMFFFALFGFIDGLIQQIAQKIIITDNVV